MKKILTAFFAITLFAACAGPSPKQTVTDSLPFVLPGGHTTPVTDVVFSPSGRYYATGSYDTLVKVWDSRTHKVLANLRGHTRPVYAVAFSPDEKTVASAGPNGIIRVWNWGHNRLLKEFRGIKSGIGALIFSPDGRYLISGSDDAAIRLWSFPEGEVIKKIEAHQGPILALALSPDGKYLLSGGTDRRIIVRQCHDWEEVNQWAMPALVADISFSPEGNLVATALWNKTVQIRRFPDGKLENTLSGHEGPVKGVSFSPDASSVASISWDGSLRTWDLASGSQTAIFYPQGKQPVLTVAWHPLDPRQVLTGGWNYISSLKPVKTTEPSCALHVWDVEAKTKMLALPSETSPLYSLAAGGPGHRLLACGSQQTGLDLWDIAQPDPFSLHLKQVIGYHNPIWSLAFHPEKPYLVYTTVRGEVRIWNLLTKKTERIIVLRDPTKPTLLKSIAVSPDGKFIATADKSEIFLLDFDGGFLRYTFKAKNSGHGSLAFHPNAKTFAAADGTKIKLIRTRHNSRHGWIEKTLKGHNAQVMALAFNSDGTYLSSIDRTGHVKIWNPSKGDAGTELVAWQMEDSAGKPLNGKAIAYSPDNGYVAAGFGRGEIVIFHLLNLKPVTRVKAHKGSVNGLQFSTDGKVLFSAGGDHLLKAWRFPSMELILSAAATTDGRTLLPTPDKAVF